MQAFQARENIQTVKMAGKRSNKPLILKYPTREMLPAMFLTTT